MTRISLEAEQMVAVGGSWLQERYHSGEGETVADFLSFESVHDINPFEVGGDHSREKTMFRRRMAVVDRMLELEPLFERALIALSNGELRRVILARALLKENGKLALVGEGGGFDASWKGRIEELARAMEPLGIELCVKWGAERRRISKPRRTAAANRNAPDERRVVVEMQGVNLSFEGREVLKDFSWTVREGERWVLRGPNGSGKTTLLALVTGDSPYSYACDVKVFGTRRGEPGAELSRTRARIGCVSSTQQAYGGESAEAQLASALRPATRLLLLDEPCCDMTDREAARFARKVVRWLHAHPRVAAVWVEHRPSRIPRDFTLVKNLV